jgi:hypothetical protein
LSPQARRNQSVSSLDLSLLPSLTTREIAKAHSKHNKTYVKQRYLSHPSGKIVFERDFGFIVQVLDHRTVRCIVAVCRPRELAILAMVAETLHSLGCRMQIGSHTVLLTVAQFNDEFYPPHATSNEVNV